MSNIKTITHDNALDLVRSYSAFESLRFSMHVPSGMPGGLSLLESTVIHCLTQFTKAKAIFEFGTYLGATTALMAENTPADCQITTLELEPSAVDIENADILDLSVQNENDNFLRHTSAKKGAVYLNHIKPENASKVSQIFCDSTQLDLTKYNLENSFDFIFIDGGHETHIIKSDSEKALKMAKDDAIIAWHDYCSGIHTDVSDFLDSFSQQHQLYHVQHTMIVLMPLGKFKKIFEEF